MGALQSTCTVLPSDTVSCMGLLRICASSFSLWVFLSLTFHSISTFSGLALEVFSSSFPSSLPPFPSSPCFSFFPTHFCLSLERPCGDLVHSEPIQAVLSWPLADSAVRSGNLDLFNGLMN